MLADARGSRNLLVRDVADQGMPERELLLSLHGAATGWTHELPARQLVQGELDLAQVDASHRRERPGPEHLADHRRILQEPLALRHQGVEPRRDQRLDALRERDSRACVAEAAVGDEAHKLLCIQRVSAGLLQDRLSHLLRYVLLDEPRDELARLPVRERREIDRVRVARTRAPGSVPLEQLRPGGTQKEERHALRPFREVRQKLEERSIGPVQILDDDDGRPVRRDRFDEAPPRGERLFARFGLAGVDSDQG